MNRLRTLKSIKESYNMKKKKTIYTYKKHQKEKGRIYHLIITFRFLELHVKKSETF